VDVATLSRDTFHRLMAESGATRAAFEQVAQARIAENTNGRNGAAHA
jgi:hypothetical protein